MCKQRFLKSIIATSKAEQPVLPWAKKRMMGLSQVSLKPALTLKQTA
ncbi:MAG: hypothetical protein ACRBBO_06840 [Cognatishimia sp.]|nr:hypothetical protein [Cognatishimia sp. 1_MG-2023]MDO6725963.1 hypothetical protein [Cognatishimia sp. 1_MG-2023]